MTPRQHLKNADALEQEARGIYLDIIKHALNQKGGDRKLAEWLGMPITTFRAAMERARLTGLRRLAWRIVDRGGKPLTEIID